jgi:hypothetical protein
LCDDIASFQHRTRAEWKGRSATDKAGKSKTTEFTEGLRNWPEVQAGAQKYGAASAACDAGVVDGIAGGS